jgi:hypothetical protein
MHSSFDGLWPCKKIKAHTLALSEDVALTPGRRAFWLDLGTSASINLSVRRRPTRCADGINEISGIIMINLRRAPRLDIRSFGSLGRGFPRCDTLTLAPAVHTHTQPGTLTLGAFSRGRHSGIGSAITVIWNSDASSHRAPMPGYPFRFALGLRLV